MNSVRHHAQRPLSLFNRARICWRTRGRLNVVPEVFFKARLLETEEGIGHRHQANVMMPAQPLAAFVMVQTQFSFQFAIVLFNPPAGFGDADETTQPERLGAELSQSVLGGLLLAFGPFHQQPLHDPWRMGVFTPPVRCPYLQHGKAKTLGFPAALAPSHVTPSPGRQRQSHLIQTLRPRQRPRRGISSRPPHLFLFRRGHGKVWGFNPDCRRRLDLHGILKTTLSQRLPKTEIIAVGRIRHHRQRRQSPGQGLVDLFQGQLRLRSIDRPRRQLDFLGPLSVFQPLLGQVDPLQQRTTGFGTRPVPADRHLAVGNFAQRTAVLSCHADRMLLGLGKRGLIQDPDFRLADQIQDFVRQASLDLFDLLRALTGELPQGLHVGSFAAAGHRLNRLALAVEQQPLHVETRPAAPFVAPHRSEQFIEKMCQPTLGFYQGSRCYAARVADTAWKVKSYLT